MESEARGPLQVRRWAPLPRRRAPPTPGCGLILLVSTTFARLGGCDSAHGSQVIIQSIHDAFLRSALALLELLLIQYGANQDPVCIPRCRNKGPRPGAGANSRDVLVKGVGSAGPPRPLSLTSGHCPSLCPQLAVRLRASAP